MMALADTIELAKRREQVEAWDKGEAEVAMQLLTKSPLPPPPEIDEETRQALQPFLQWSTKTQVRYCPAKPLTVAAYVLERAATGASTDQLLRQLNAISTLHDRHNLASPVGTHAVRAALESVTGFEPPRIGGRRKKKRS